MELEEVLEQCLGQNFVHMIISNPKKGDFAGKVDVRCYEDKRNAYVSVRQIPE